MGDRGRRFREIGPERAFVAAKKSGWDEGRDEPVAITIGVGRHTWKQTPAGSVPASRMASEAVVSGA